VAEGDRERWDARHRDAGLPVPAPVAFLQSLDAALPRRGRALDLASGRGRVALALARRGLDVLACDVSPVGLALAVEAARLERLTLRTEVRDLEVEGPPAGPWDLVTCFHYLDRPLLRGLGAILAEGGHLVVEIATVRNLERHAHPSRRFLLEPDELHTLVEGVTVLRYEEGWSEGHHRARLWARA